MNFNGNGWGQDKDKEYKMTTLNCSIVVWSFLRKINTARQKITLDSYINIFIKVFSMKEMFSIKKAKFSKSICWSQEKQPKRHQRW